MVTERFEDPLVGGPKQDGSTTSTEYERSYVSMLYDQLDEYRESLQRQLADVRLASGSSTHQWRTERDALARQLERRLSSLSIGDLPLCFGRLDLDDGSRLHVGRVGIAGEGDEPLLMDWRAPIAALFYSATPGDPQGVVRRRHLLTKGRDVVAIDDEIFDLDALDADETNDLRGDAALLAAVSRERTGHMRDIVATIQREQDDVIRSGIGGVLVVQGGPGTGKTAVALHRAAYLLYTHRVRLASSGVLVVGPNPVFLRYIEQVLPSLGETGALLSTVHSLIPGVRPTRHDTAEIAALKGRPEMATLLARAVRDRQRVPRERLELAFERSRVVFDPEALERARRAGRRSQRPHNQARRSVEASLLDVAINQVRAQLIATGGAELVGDELAETRRALRRSREFRAVMERVWPLLTPEQLLNDLFGTVPLLRSAAKAVPELAAAAMTLGRPRAADPTSIDWSIEDVPLLDEAAEQLGSAAEQDEERRARQRRRQRERELDFADRVLQSMDLDITINPERFAERFADYANETIAEQAVRDRTWRFGHVIVDEAQELSPMAWRMLFRRNPNRSMTIVGDLAQSGSSWSPRSWSEALDEHAKSYWRVAELTVNYRTPAEIMEVANAVLTEAAPGTVPTRAIRSSGDVPIRMALPPDELTSRIGEVAAEVLSQVGEGRVAVIAPPSMLAELTPSLETVLGADFSAQNPLGAKVALVTVGDVKGLEFDAVVLVEPARIVSGSERGMNDLYVALTRATQRLVVLHAEALPSVLSGLLPEGQLPAPA